MINCIIIDNYNNNTIIHIWFNDGYCIEYYNEPMDAIYQEWAKEKRITHKKSRIIIGD